MDANAETAARIHNALRAVIDHTLSARAIRATAVIGHELMILRRGDCVAADIDYTCIDDALVDIQLAGTGTTHRAGSAACVIHALRYIIRACEGFPGEGTT